MARRGNKTAFNNFVTGVAAMVTAKKSKQVNMATCVANYIFCWMLAKLATFQQEGHIEKCFSSHVIAD